MGTKILVCFIGLGVIALGFYLINWTVKSLDTKTHQKTTYLDVPAGTGSITVVLFILVTNLIFHLIPVSVMRIIIIIFSIGLWLLGSYLIYTSFMFV